MTRPEPISMCLCKGIPEVGPLSGAAANRRRVRGPYMRHGSGLPIWLRFSRSTREDLPGCNRAPTLSVTRGLVFMNSGLQVPLFCRSNMYRVHIRQFAPKFMRTGLPSECTQRSYRLQTKIHVRTTVERCALSDIRMPFISGLTLLWTGYKGLHRPRSPLAETNLLAGLVIHSLPYVPCLFLSIFSIFLLIPYFSDLKTSLTSTTIDMFWDKTLVFLGLLAAVGHTAPLVLPPGSLEHPQNDLALFHKRSFEDPTEEGFFYRGDS
jgi:hypothetical protein